MIKVEGSGNDFLLGTGSWADRIRDRPELVVRLCHRRRGIGADGALAVWREHEGRVRLVHRNADGSEAAFCGNGTRCAARAAVELFGCRSELEVVTGWSVIPATVEGATVSLRLPAPSEAPEWRVLATPRGPVEGWFVIIGVPHLVVAVQDPEAVDLAVVAPLVRHHPDLGPAGANISFVTPPGSEPVAIRTWERGVEGETLACGSGVVAAGLVSMAQCGRQELRLRPASGDELRVRALGEPPSCPVELTGPTRLVAEITPSSELLG